MKYKAIFSDFDGTLCEVPPVSNKNIQAIQDYINQGGKFFISTGRLFQSIYPHYLSLNIQSDYIITSQGAEVIDLKNNKIEKRFCMDEDFVKKASDFILSKIKKYPKLEALMYINDECYFMNNNPEYVEEFCKILKVKDNRINCSLYEYVKKTGAYPTKLLVLLENKELELFLKEAKLFFNESANLCKSRDFLLEIMPKGIDKGQAVKYVCEKCDIMLEDVICVGDSDNDLAMIKVAGLGVATQNAYDSVKACAKYISLSANADALDDVIHKFCLGEIDD